MSPGHFFGAHQKLDLRPLGGPDLFVLELGDVYVTTDRAGIERLWDLLDRALGKQVAKGADEELHPALRVELARLGKMGTPK